SASRIDSVRQYVVWDDRHWWDQRRRNAVQDQYRWIGLHQLLRIYCGDQQWRAGDRVGQQRRGFAAGGFGFVGRDFVWHGVFRRHERDRNDIRGQHQWNGFHESLHVLVTRRCGRPESRGRLVIDPRHAIRDGFGRRLTWERNI